MAERKESRLPDGQAGARIAVALSGGGHRATLFGLGALMFLVDAGRQKDTVSIASVSGGSLTNGFVAQTLDFRKATPDEFAIRVAQPLASQIARRGTLFVPLRSKLYLALLVLGFVAAWTPLFLLSSACWIRLGACLAALVAWGWFLGLRGTVCALAFRDTLFSPGGQVTRLGQIAKDCSHVICATDLRSAETAYFSGSFVYGYAYGVGQPGDLPLYRAVQASAAYPGGFPPARIGAATFGFKATGDRKVRSVAELVLSDGGVYDNMGDQWARGFARRAEGSSWLDPQAQPDQLVVVNASARVPWTPFRRGRIPLLGELAALLRVNSVMYVNTTNVRRQDIVASYDPTAPGKAGPLPGALVQIAQSPFVVADAYADAQGDVGQRAQAVLAALGNTREPWAEIARKNAEVETTLSELGAGVSARLLYQGYVVALCNLHVIFGPDLGWPLLPIPRLDRFEELV